MPHGYLLCRRCLGRVCGRHFHHYAFRLLPVPQLQRMRQPPLYGRLSHVGSRQRPADRYRIRQGRPLLRVRNLCGSLPLPCAQTGCPHGSRCALRRLRQSAIGRQASLRRGVSRACPRVWRHRSSTRPAWIAGMRAAFARGRAYPAEPGPFSCSGHARLVALTASPHAA